MFEVGDKIRNYEIVARLKPGGMGTLLLARRVGAAGFSQNVAIKVIHPHLSSENTFVRAFVNEALLASKVAHPNVVRVEELGEEEGIYFLVMEYVRGCNLAQLLIELGKRKRTLVPEAAVAIAVRALDGLHAAHETKDEHGKPLGLVHRDVSPQNILLSFAGEIKLIDFGIAKARDRESTTAAGTLKGKLRYMSPEQAYGREIDRRADVYALGICLWEMLAQRRLFRGGNNFRVLDQVRKPKIVSPRQYAPRVSEQLSNVVMQALSPLASERPASARELRRLLLEALPSAMQVEADQLAELVAETVGDADIQLSSGAIPIELAPPKIALRERDDVVPTLTISGALIGASNLEAYAFEDVDLADLDSPSSPADTSAPADEIPPVAARSKLRIAGYAAGLLVIGLIIGFGVEWFFALAKPVPAPVVIVPVDKPPPPPPLPSPPVPVVEKVVAPPEEPQPSRPVRVKKKTKTKQNVDGVPIIEEVPF